MAKDKSLDLKPWHFDKEEVRILHWTWLAFFLTFYVWFNMAPLATTMLKNMGWLTKEHIKVLAICNVALTIPARVIIGAMIDRFGPRNVFSLLMVITGVINLFFAYGDSFLQLLIARLILSTVGAGFVIGIRMIGQWFPPKYIGRAEGLYAGWGNFGSAAAAMTLPSIALYVFGGANGWRHAIAFSGAAMLLYGILYYFVVRDVPKTGPTKSYHFRKVKKVQPLILSSQKDLIQYLIWSFPLIGALGLLAWRVNNIKVDGKPVIPELIIYGVYVILAIMYLSHIIKTWNVNKPYLKKGVPEDYKFYWGNVAALCSTYFANFGAELAVVSMLPAFFESVFSLDPTKAGLVAASFAFVNLVARPLGGYLSDTLGDRKKTMLIYMLGIAIGFLAMGFIPKYGPIVGGEQTLLPMFDGMWWLVIAVVITIICSMFVQGAEGATFAFIPLINKRFQGQIAGLAGAYGNVGAVVYLVIYSLVDDKTFFFILATGAFLSFLYCLFTLKEPEGSFAEE